MISPESELGNIEPFMNKVFAALEVDKIDVSDYYLDHICYRVETLARYTVVKDQLKVKNKQISEKIIHGRPIAIFRLRNPLYYKKRIFDLLELPAPKDGSPHKEGFEHVEFVVPSLEVLKQKCKDINFNEDPIPNNRTLILKYAGFSVKFHELPLNKVIEIEI